MVGISHSWWWKETWESTVVTRPWAVGGDGETFTNSLHFPNYCWPGFPPSLARVSRPACLLFAAQRAITFPTLLGGDARQCPSFNKNLEHQSGSCSCLQAPARRAPPALACSARGMRIRDLRAPGPCCQLQGLRKTPKQACLGTGGKTQDGPLKHHSWWQRDLAQPFQSCSSPSGATLCDTAPRRSAKSGDKRQRAGSLCTKETGGWDRGGGS